METMFRQISQISHNAEKTNYTDRHFWLAHYTNEIETLSGTLNNISSELLIERFYELRGIIGKNTLSPFFYQQGLIDLIEQTNIKGLIEHYSALKEALIDFQQQLLFQPDFTVENFEADLLKTMALVIKGKKTTIELQAILAFYKEVISREFFEIINQRIKPFIDIFDKEKSIIIISPSTCQAFYQHLLAAFIQIKQRLQKNQDVEIEAIDSIHLQNKNADEIKLPFVTGSLNSLISRVFAWSKQASQFAIKHPVQALIVSLATQVSATAAFSILSSIQKNHRDDPQDALTILTEKTQPLEISPSVVSPILESSKTDSNIFSSLPNYKDSLLIESSFPISNSGSEPVAISLDNGNALVIWWEQTNEMYGQLLTATGDKISLPFFIAASATNSNSYRPAVTSLRNGNFAVTWWNEATQEGNSVFNMQGQIITANGDKVGSGFTMLPPPPFIANDGPAITSLSNGNFVATYTAGYSLGNSPALAQYVQLLDINGNKIGEQFQVNNYALPIGAAIASLSDGNFVVTSHSLLDNVIYAQIFNANGTQLVNTFEISSFGLAHQVHGLTDGNFVIGWYQDKPFSGLFIKLFTGLGEQIGKTTQVADFFVASSNYYRSEWDVIGLSKGNFVVVWNNEPHLYGQIFNAQAERIGKVFSFNIFNTLVADRHPAVAALSDNNLMITWDSLGLDDTNPSIEGNIIDTHLTATNTNQVINYSMNKFNSLQPIIIAPPVFIDTVAATLTLSDPGIGALTTGTFNNVTSTYNSTSGIWQASGDVANVNYALANLNFQPISNTEQELRIEVKIEDNFNDPINGTMHLYPAPISLTSSTTGTTDSSSHATTNFGPTSSTTVNVNPAHNTQTDDTGNVIEKSLIGSASGIATALVGFCIWKYKNYKDEERTRQDRPLANYIYQALKIRGTSNFKSEYGQEYIEAIDTIVGKLEGQLKEKHEIEVIFQRLPIKVLKELAPYIVDAIRHSTSTDTTWLGHANITVNNIKDRAEAIVNKLIKDKNFVKFINEKNKNQETKEDDKAPLILKV